ncbi:MAG: ATP-binding cassette domain-containing protein [Deltaproteobacteria bacterium]|nr:ATP-binding cassette domain-containing protein [Deltaproteobacteria bacterium]
MALINLRDISVSYGGPLVLEKINLQVEKGERLCIIGRNGEGKSTLMRVICGEVAPGEGVVSLSPGIRIAMLTQEIPHELEGSVYEVVAKGLDEVGALIVEHHRITREMGEIPGEKLLTRLEDIQHQLEAKGGWSIQQRVETVISRLEMDGDSEFKTLSGGLKRRALLARALVVEPDLLLLDEPTNHLDIEAIQWLEESLLTFKSALLFVTHDRMLLEKLATRIVELDRGKLTSWPGDYRNYLRRLEERLNAEGEQQRLFDKKLAQEEAWVRQGIKARRTRNEGRVRALEELREVARERRERIGTAGLELQKSDQSGKIVAKVKDISFAYGDIMCVRNFSTTILRGDKVGVIGPNGSGKTTLLRLLLGELEPDRGSVRLGARLEVAYFDQLRARLDEEKSVEENVVDNGSHVTINGKERHVIGYLKDFLFSPQRARTPVKALSGGERNRLLLAKLFTRPANVLVMDEPTNDLDVETLELLEERLVAFAGTLLLVSHDRAFLNNVVTTTIVFGIDGKISEYVGGYDDMLRQHGASPPEPTTKVDRKVEEKSNNARRVQTKSAVKLTFKEERDLAALPKQIDALESEQERLHEEMGNPAFYQRGGDHIAAAKTRLECIEEELVNDYQRWEELERKKSAAAAKNT